METLPVWLEASYINVALLGENNANFSLTQCLPQNRPLNFMSFEVSHIFPPRLHDEDEDNVRGILSERWFHRRLYTVPAVVVLLFIWCKNQDINSLNKLIKTDVKKFLFNNSTREFVPFVVISRETEPLEDEDYLQQQVSNVYRQVSLARSDVFLLTSLNTEEAILQLEEQIYARAIEYFNERIFALKQKRDLLIQNSSLNKFIAYEIKLGFYSQLQGLHENAIKFYTSGYTQLQQLSIDNFFVAIEIKNIAHLLNSMICKIYMELNETKICLDLFQQHIVLFQTTHTPSSLEWVHHAWMQKQYEIFSLLLLLLLQNHPEETHDIHIGDLLQSASMHARRRKSSAKLALRHWRPSVHVDVLDSLLQQSPYYFGQVPREHEFSEDDVTSANVLMYGESCVDHTHIIISLLDMAHQCYHKKGYTRKCILVSARKAQCYFESGNFKSAYDLFYEVCVAFRQECWIEALQANLSMALSCASRLQAYTMMAAHSAELATLEQDNSSERSLQLHETMMSAITLIQDQNDVNEQQIIDISQCTFVEVFCSFDRDDVCEGEKLMLHIRIESMCAKPLEFSRLKLQANVHIDNDDDDDDDGHPTETECELSNFFSFTISSSSSALDDVSVVSLHSNNCIIDARKNFTISRSFSLPYKMLGDIERNLKICRAYLYVRTDNENPVRDVALRVKLSSSITRLSLRRVSLTCNVKQHSSSCALYEYLPVTCELHIGDEVLESGEISFNTSDHTCCIFVLRENKMSALNSSIDIPRLKAQSTTKLQVFFYCSTMTSKHISISVIYVNDVGCNCQLNFIHDVVNILSPFHTRTSLLKSIPQFVCNNSVDDNMTSSNTVVCNSYTLLYIQFENVFSESLVLCDVVFNIDEQSFESSDQISFAGKNTVMNVGDVMSTIVMVKPLVREKISPGIVSVMWKRAQKNVYLQTHEVILSPLDAVRSDLHAQIQCNRIASCGDILDLQILVKNDSVFSHECELNAESSSAFAVCGIRHQQRILIPPQENVCVKLRLAAVQSGFVSLPHITLTDTRDNHIVIDLLTCGNILIKPLHQQ